MQQVSISHKYTSQLYLGRKFFTDEVLQRTNSINCKTHVWDKKTVFMDTQNRLPDKPVKKLQNSRIQSIDTSKGRQKRMMMGMAGPWPFLWIDDGTAISLSIYLSNRKFIPLDSLMFWRKMYVCICTSKTLTWRCSGQLLFVCFQKGGVSSVQSKRLRKNKKAHHISPQGQ